MTNPFSSSELEFLGGQFLGRLATVDADGAPQNNPVGFRVNDDGTIDIGGRAMAQTRKWRNVADHASVALVVDDLPSTNPWTVRGVEIRGDATQVTLDEPMSAYAQPEVIRIRPRRIISWGIDPDRAGMASRDA